MERRQLVSWAVVVAAAALVLVLQRVAGPAVWAIGLILRVLILVGLGVFAYRLWREHRSRLQFLPTGRRVLFAVLGAVIVLAVLASFLLPLTLLTSLLLLAVVGGCAFAMWRIWDDAGRWY